jgi:hypothetical protein
MPFLTLGGSFLLSSTAKGSKNELEVAAEETFKFPNTSLTKRFCFPRTKRGVGAMGLEGRV